MKMNFKKFATVCLATTLVCATFGATANADVIIGQYTGSMIGDINCDGVIDLTDVTMLQTLINKKIDGFLLDHFGNTYKWGDCNDDGRVNQKDVDCLKEYVMNH